LPKIILLTILVEQKGGNWRVGQEDEKKLKGGRIGDIEKIKGEGEGEGEGRKKGRF
jgi:hypothetical protein